MHPTAEVTRQTIRSRIHAITETAQEAIARLSKADSSLCGPRPSGLNAPNQKSPNDPSIEALLDNLHDALKRICESAAFIGNAVG